MKLVESAISGTMESSDVMITIRPIKENGIKIDLQSTVEKQFGRQIRTVIEETIKSLGIHDADVIVVDKGALDCTIRARTMTAVYRACGEENYTWKQTIQGDDLK